jgi:hypothetical protein
VSPKTTLLGLWFRMTVACLQVAITPPSPFRGFRFSSFFVGAALKDVEGGAGESSMAKAEVRVPPVCSPFDVVNAVVKAG